MFCVRLDQIPKTLKHIGGEVCLHSKLTSHIFRCQLGAAGGNDGHVSFSTHCHSVSLNLLCSFSNEQLFFLGFFFCFLHQLQLFYNQTLASSSSSSLQDADLIAYVIASARWKRSRLTDRFYKIREREKSSEY